MESIRRPELDVLASELEEEVLIELETPDNVATELGHQIDLSDGQSVRFEYRTGEETIGRSETGDITAVFVSSHGEVTSELECSYDMSFSALYDHLTSNLGGMQYRSPDDSPLPIEGNYMEVKALENMLNLSRYIYDQNLQIEDQSEPWNVDRFDLDSSDMPDELKLLLNKHLFASAQLLTFGSYHERRVKYVGSDDSGLRLESNLTRGDTKHLHPAAIDRSELSVSYTEEGVQHTFEVNPQGLYEIRTQIADPVERYKLYRTYVPTGINSDGEVYGFSINRNEIHEKQQEERDAGMYDLNEEGLNTFLGRLSLALSETN